jgi:hypothetical protein
LAAGLAGLRVVWVAVRERSLNPFATVMLVVFGLGLVLALVSGDARFLLLKNSIVTGSIGLVFLVSVLWGTPLSLAASQSFQPERRDQIRRAYARPPGQLDGVGPRAARRGARAGAVLPISVMVGLSEVLSVAVIAGLVAWNLWYVRRLGAREAAARSAQPE